ncbi:MAG TPA: hypothetical protein VF062_04080 [Candidatus Limnocylindrales bacterium]
MSTSIAKRLTAAVSAGILAATIPTTQSNAAGTVEDLGVAMYTPNVRLATSDVLADGTPLAYVFSDGRPVSFNVVDIRSGALVDSINLDPYTVASSIVVADDDTVYFSVRSPNDGSLWRYTPQTKQLQKVFTGLVDEEMLRTLIIHNETIYGSTYPDAKVYSYNTITGQVRDYGSVVTDGDYAWGLALVDGKLWVGTGAEPHLKTVDVATGEIGELPLPPGAVNSDFVNTVVRRGDLVFVRYSPATADSYAAYDLATGQWCCAGALGTASPSGWTRGTLGNTFFYGLGSNVYAYDYVTRQRASIGFESSALAGKLSGTTSMDVLVPGTPEEALIVGVRDDGSLWRYNLATQTGDVVASAIKGSPVTVHSIGNGPDGNVYFGAYLSAGVMARVNRKTGRVEQMSGPSQADKVIEHRGQIVVGTYPNAGFYSGDLSQPWGWGTNPKHLFTLGRAEPHEQDRPLTMVSAGKLVAAGTIPNYGELGGSLVLFDPVTGAFEAHRNIVRDQSITALAYSDGIAFGGTSIHGGLSSTPTASEAELFGWDMRSNSFIHLGVPVPGATIIHALAFDPTGRLWGMTDTGVLFEYDVAKRKVLRTLETGIPGTNVWGRLSELYYRQQDAYMYGSAGGKLFRFRPSGGEPRVEVLVTGEARQSGMDRDGNLYFANETNVFRYHP